MHHRQSSLGKIQAAAIQHFSERNYDAASLLEIAEQVGIRKASIYSHFANKEALFMAALVEAITVEKEFASSCFAFEDGTTQAGISYCHHLLKRYTESEHLRFLLRAGYLPPENLFDAVNDIYTGYLGLIHDLYQQKLVRWLNVQYPDMPPHVHDLLQILTLQQQNTMNIYVQNYMGIIDSLHVKLVYTHGQDISLRIDAMLKVLNDALYNATLAPKGE